jgi:hypothetical protein
MRQEPLARRLPWVLAALCAVWLAALAPRLIYPDLNLDYPFVDGDSHDWIANGLHLAGHDVRYSGRSPLLPLALAGLDRLGLLRLWPPLGLLLFLATVLVFHSLAARLAAPAAAFAAALMLLASYTLQGLALEVMADVPASCLMLWSAWAFVTAMEGGAGAEAPGDAGGPGGIGKGIGKPEGLPERRHGLPRRYVLGGLLAGLAALTQQIGLIVPVAALAALGVRRRRELGTPWPWIGLLTAAALPGLWLAVKRWAFAAYGDSLLDQWGLLGLHASSLRPYLWSLLSFLGLPACLLLVVGIALVARRVWRGGDERAGAPRASTEAPAATATASTVMAATTAAETTATAARTAMTTTASTAAIATTAAAAWLFVLLLLAGCAGFFALFYGYEAKRFAVYAVWPAALLVAGALDPLARRTRPASWAAFVAVAALAIGGAALPLPEPAHDGNWAALWPLPSTVAGRRGAMPWMTTGADAAGSSSAASPGAALAASPGAASAAASATAPRALAAATIARLPLATAAHWGALPQVLRAWAGRPREDGGERPEPHAFAADLAALYLFDKTDDGGGRYRTITRLSNALWKPVRFVPRAALGPFWNLMDIRRVAPLTADYLVYRATLPGIAGSWLLVTPGDRPIPAAPAPETSTPEALQATPPGTSMPRAPQPTPLAGSPAQAARATPRESSLPTGGPATPGNPAPAERPRFAAAAAEAEAVAAWIGRGQAYVALFLNPASRDLAQLHLPFLVQTTELYVVEPADAAAARRFLGQAPVEAERRFGAAKVEETRVRGLRTAIVSFLP